MAKDLSRILRLCKSALSDHVELDADEIKKARTILIRYSQQGMEKELKDAMENSHGRYRKLSPAVNKDGVWCVGAQLKNHVPFTIHGKLPILIIASLH